MIKQYLFIDRDGTLIKEPPDEQVDSFEKLVFMPGVFKWLGKLAGEPGVELIMVTNQDGLGTSSFPEEDFWPVQNFMVDTLAAEGIRFSEILIDRSFAHEQLSTRKPGTGLLTKYLALDLSNSFVIGDRQTDVQLAENLGCRSILFTDWQTTYNTIRSRKVEHMRITNETDIRIVLDPDGSGEANINTGISFFDHMLEQLARHSKTDIAIITKGDLHIDEHHTIEDTAIALGEAILKAIGNKAGLERYGFCLPMDDALAQVSIDFGGRPWLVWDATFTREKIGDMPTEMFFHFFKSFSDAARCNLNIKVSGNNEHHKIESIFKAFARSMRMALKRDIENMSLPTTKGKL